MEANTLYQVQDIYNKSCFIEHTNFFLKMLENHLRDVFIDLEQCAFIIPESLLKYYKTKQSTVCDFCLFPVLWALSFDVLLSICFMMMVYFQ